MMDGGFIMEPDLTQAVRIVLKYEIQSLLSRLSETGEEYIVLTASTDEGTCGHIGSEKGEGFVKSSGLSAVKQDFLNFCKGKENSPPTLKAVNATSTPRTNRRKSTPRCKFQARQAVVVPFDETELSEFPQSIKESNFAATESITESSSALDLSEKADGYAYTLESRDDIMKYNGSESQSSISGFQFEELDNNESLYKIKLPHFTWQDEKLQPVSQDTPVSSLDQSVLDAQSNSLNQSKSSVLDQISFGDLSVFGGTSAIASGGKQQLGVRNRRKNRKAPVKMQRKDGEQKKVALLQPASSSFGVVNEENHVETFVNQISSLDVSKDNETVNSETVNNHFSAKLGVSSGVKKAVKKHSMHNITDMKSAFEEIGNMAKCLICNKVLANKNNRTFHWRSHVGDKRYTCDICNKAFTHPSNMRSHRKIHTDEKPFPCDLCERRFRRRDYLLQHLERFHYNPKPSTEKSLIDGESNSS